MSNACGTNGLGRDREGEIDNDWPFQDHQITGMYDVRSRERVEEEGALLKRPSGNMFSRPETFAKIRLRDVEIRAHKFGLNLTTTADAG